MIQLQKVVNLESVLTFVIIWASLLFDFVTFHYCILQVYLQIKFSWRKCWLVRPFIQLLVFFLAYYTALTRISDYMHHWSDVLGGAVLGSIVCFFTVSVYSFLLFFTAKSLLFGLLIEFHSNGG